MTSEEKADQIILALDLKKEDRDYLIRGFNVHAAEARAELSYRVKRHLEMVDERECSLDTWNCICDALLELHNDE